MTDKCFVLFHNLKLLCFLQPCDESSRHYWHHLPSPHSVSGLHELRAQFWLWNRLPPRPVHDQDQNLWTCQASGWTRGYRYTIIRQVSTITVKFLQYLQILPEKSILLICWLGTYCRIGFSILMMNMNDG